MPPAPAVRDSLDCLGPDAELVSALEFRETPLTFRLIILHRGILGSNPGSAITLSTGYAVVTRFYLAGYPAKHPPHSILFDSVRSYS
jgi:hypothetical protein